MSQIPQEVRDLETAIQAAIEAINEAEAKYLIAKPYIATFGEESSEQGIVTHKIAEICRDECQKVVDMIPDEA